jgi:hypothetical protein
MMRLIIYSLIIALFACSNRTAIPKDIIQPDSMRVIMMDIFMANEYALQFISKDSLKPDKVKAGQDLLEDIFKIHHTSKESFKKSLKFYESRPDMNKKIFDSLAAYANQHKAELYMPKTPVKGNQIPGNPLNPKRPPFVPKKQNKNLIPPAKSDTIPLK